MKAREAAGRTCSWTIITPGLTLPSQTFGFLRPLAKAKTLWVAGNRESLSPGIGERAERYLMVVFRRIVEGRND